METNLLHEPNNAQTDARVWLGPREMAIRPEPVPQTATGQLLLEATAAGICGSELSGYGRKYPAPPSADHGTRGTGRIGHVNGGTLADGSTPQVGQRVTFNQRMFRRPRSLLPFTYRTRFGKIDEAFIAEHLREEVFFDLFKENWQHRPARLEEDGTSTSPN